MFRGCGHCSSLLWEYSCSICGALWEVPRDGLPLPPAIGLWVPQNFQVLRAALQAASSVNFSQHLLCCRECIYFKSTKCFFSETKMFQDLGFVENFQKLETVSNGKETMVQRFKMPMKTKSEFSGGLIKQSAYTPLDIKDASVFSKPALKLFPGPPLK